MEKGLGTSAVLDVPARYNARGLGDGGARGCPPLTYCVENAGPYPPQLSVTDALAQSPNTAFVKLIEATGVDPVVDMSVRLGLRSYAQPNTSGFGEQSMADMQKDQHLGSYTLGPTWINPLELSNVAATLASHGKWCPPSPIDGVFDREGKPVPITQQACEQVVEPGLADTLANAMSKDTAGAAPPPVPPVPSAGACRSQRRRAPPNRTCRRRSSVSPTSTPAPCTPTVTPPHPPGGNLLRAGATVLQRQPVRRYRTRPDVVQRDAARRRQVRSRRAAARRPEVRARRRQRSGSRRDGPEPPAGRGAAAGLRVHRHRTQREGRGAGGTVTNSAPSGSAVPGSTITIYISDGTVRAAPTTTATPARPDGNQVPDTTAPNAPAPIPNRPPAESEPESEAPSQSSENAPPASDDEGPAN